MPTRTIIKVAGLVVSSMAKTQPVGGGWGMQVLKSVVVGMQSGATPPSPVAGSDGPTPAGGSLVKSDNELVMVPESQSAHDALLAMFDQKDHEARELAKTDPANAAKAEANNNQQRQAHLSQSNLMGHQTAMSIIRNMHN